MDAEAGGGKTCDKYIPFESRVGKVEVVLYDAQTSFQSVGRTHNTDGVRYRVSLVTVIGRGACGQIGCTSRKQNNGV